MTEARRAARDSRKQATREALWDAAMRLALEGGPGNVRYADIAAAVGVPLSVYHSCFASGEQVIVAAVVDEQKARLVSAVAARRMMRGRTPKRAPPGPGRLIPGLPSGGASRPEDLQFGDLRAVLHAVGGEVELDVLVTGLGRQRDRDRVAG